MAVPHLLKLLRSTHVATWRGRAHLPLPSPITARALAFSPRAVPGQGGVQRHQALLASSAAFFKSHSAMC